jgi:cytochrome c oxidase subunit 2
MPAPVRRFASVLAATALLALVIVGVAATGNGGIAPPEPASPGAAHIRDIYWLILGVTGGIFLLVEGALVLFMIKYRSRGRPREVEGPQVRGHTNLELAWTAGPVVLLAVIAGFVFYKVSGIDNTSGIPPAQGATPVEQIRIEGHQYYWEFVYPDGTIAVDHLRVPYNRVVRLQIVAHDVDHSWWVPALGGKLDAIPGKKNYTSFRATKLGTFRGQCAEFCGIQHAAMIARVEVLPQARYDAWRRERHSSALGLGQETFVGVCAKCHGLAGQGDIGPAIAQSPLLKDREALTTLLHEGIGTMPAVGQTWNDTQLNALVEYLGKRFGQGGGSGG